jgi:hypothetical protein
VRPSEDSKTRLKAMKNRLTLRPLRPMDWLAVPVLFEQTVLAMEACPATGILRVRGIERLAAISTFERTFEAA